MNEETKETTELQQKKEPKRKKRSSVYKLLNSILVVGMSIFALSILISAYFSLQNGLINYFEEEIVDDAD